MLYIYVDDVDAHYRQAQAAGASIVMEVDDRPWGDKTPPAAWYASSPDRKGEHPKAHLSGFAGTLQADAYAGYDAVYEGGRVKEAACMAHVRRRFYDLYEAHKSAVAKEALERIAALYAIEEEIRGRSAEERRAVRNERSRPLLESLKQWMEETLGKLSRKSDTTKAIRYALDRWDALLRFSDDGHLEVDNNAAERSLRAVVLGRNVSCLLTFAWLICDLLHGLTVRDRHLCDAT